MHNSNYSTFLQASSLLCLVLPLVLTSAIVSPDIQHQMSSVIRISYKDLIQQSPTAISCARMAFCDRDSFGALEIYDIPEWKTCREQVMKLGRQLALDQSEEGIRARDECRGDVRVGPGWMGSPGHETHSLQSGFYGNMKNNEQGNCKSKGNSKSNSNSNDNDCQVQVWGANRWPNLKQPENDEAGFRASVTAATSLMHATALSTLDLAQKAAQEIMEERYECKGVAGNNSNVLPPLREMAEQSNFLPTRLVYYDAKFSREDAIMGSDSDRDDGTSDKYWLPWHLDFNLATVFAPAAWIDEMNALNNNNLDALTPLSLSSGTNNPEHESGLLLRNPKGTIIPAAIGEDCMLIQLGAHAQLATGGILRSGPHAVKKSAQSANFGRLSFGLFVYGPWNARMKPSSDLLGVIGGDEGILKDDFGCLMEKAYTGDTVLEGYKKFEQYMNG